MIEFPVEIKVLLISRQEKKIYQYSLLNNDFKDRKEDMFLRNLSNKIAYQTVMDASSLIEANKDSKRNGKLKEIAGGLNEDDNPVVMLVEYKK